MREKIEKYIQDWQKRCYSDLPDEAPNEINHLVPSYKKICMAILKNDTQLETLGFSRAKCKIYNELKRIELKERGVIKPDPQLKLFDIWQMFM
jgi:predicted phosphoadenosine phosphosulfate sulfurtransferase